jgi:hypothetical protein
MPFALTNRLPGILAPLVGPMLVVLCWSGPALETGRAQMTQPELRKFVREALEKDTFPVSKPVIRFDKDALRFDLGSVDLGEGFDYWRYPVEDQFKVELIRNYPSSAEQRRRWEAQLQRAEDVIDKELTLIGRHEREKKKRPADDDEKLDNKLEEMLQGYSKYTDRILVAILDRAAEERNLIAISIHGDLDIPLIGSQPVQAKVATVKIVTRPAGADVYYLSEGAYHFKERAGLAADPKNWLVAGDSIDVWGKNYRFYVRWEDLGKTKITGTYPIRGGQTIVLKP